MVPSCSERSGSTRVLSETVTTSNIDLWSLPAMHGDLWPKHMPSRSRSHRVRTLMRTKPLSTISAALGCYNTVYPNAPQTFPWDRALLVMAAAKLHLSRDWRRARFALAAMITGASILCGSPRTSHSPLMWTCRTIATTRLPLPIPCHLTSCKRRDHMWTSTGLRRLRPAPGRGELTGVLNAGLRCTPNRQNLCPQPWLRSRWVFSRQPLDQRELNRQETGLGYVAPRNDDEPRGRQWPMVFWCSEAKVQVGRADS